ncbi:CheR family methyltransferase [Paenibacillus aurantius]|uniref:CheR family methyltransferase n=2 Tax=Paenibacillus aurantius TaxID=2918900 RepID=A0AA96LE20_9BACL|nr:CheR family methyltransferase [Paenibacillus aurantius]WNQ10381.1 CheR family methyltransferase [Paenibacillus aurantius]
MNRVPTESEMAFVAVPCLPADSRSLEPDGWAGHSPREALPVRNGTQVEPNRLYLNLTGKDMTLSGGRLWLEEHPLPGPRRPVDLFLTSLAQECGPKAAAILLSEAGEDGKAGAAAVKKAGGLVLVPAGEAPGDGNAGLSINLSEGSVDAVLPPAEMASFLGKRLDAGEREAQDQAAPESEMDAEERQKEKVLKKLELETGIDFSSYKRNGVSRRLERRMKLHGIGNTADYMAFLEAFPDEAAALQKDLLIGVTKFYRDPQAFEVIRSTVIPELVDALPDHRELRVWVAGCSTGEEAYSLAILFKSYLDEQGRDLSVKIFATDLDKGSIDFAGQGIYREDISRYLPRRELDRFFVRKGSSYQIGKEIRRMVVFAVHNLIKDPPFINLDLVSCRNMLIYLQPAMQHKVLSMFHFSLKPNGFLFLGPSESLGKLAEHFTVQDRRWNVYRRKPAGPLSRVNGRPGPLPTPLPIRSKGERPFPRLPEGHPVQPSNGVAETLMEQYLPPCLVVNENNQVVHLGGPVNRFLLPGRARTGSFLYQLTSSRLSALMATGLHKARREKREVRLTGILLPAGEEEQVVSLVIKPFMDKPSGDLFLLLFEEATKGLENAAEPEGFVSEGQADMNHRIVELGHELQMAQDSLEDTVEKLEASNEELLAANEELVISNEELQCTNEELQSANEELVTVNTEYQLKIAELSDLTNDMDNLLSSTKIGTIFLDNDMCIKRFTPVITKEINLMAVDIGRPLGHISHNLKYDGLVRDAQEVFRTLIPLEREVQSRSGSWYSMNILPYRTKDQVIKGIILTFVDISEIKSAAEELRTLSYAIEQSPSIVVIADTTGAIEYVNLRFTEQTGYPPHEVIGRSLRDLHAPGGSRQLYEEIWEVVNSGSKWTGEMETVRKNGDTFWEGVSILPITNPEGEIIHVLRVSQDITERKNTEELLRKSEMLSAVGQLAAGIAHEIRNPLTALKGFTKLLDAGTNNKTYTQIMTAELDRIESIISELLVLAKPQVWNFHRKDVVLILQDVIMLLDTQAIMNKVEIDVSFAPDIPPIQCVENQLKQVFINLLKNGIEAMPEGGRLQVKVERADGNRLRILFIDEGMGIPEEKIPKLGEPFYSTKEKGTGLGLMVSFKIIENHQGQMQITSELGKGTTVQIVLPLSS